MRETDLLSKGLDSKLAQSIIKSSLSLSEISTLNDEQLQSLGINKQSKKLLFSTRPRIPDCIVNNLMSTSRRTCCICRNEKSPIVIHHIIPWSESQDHSEDNLVILCTHHHEEVHTKRELSKNILPDELKSAKEAWLKKVEELDLMICKKQYSELSIQTKKLSILKNKWYNLFKSLGLRIEIIDAWPDSLKFDFIIYGKQTIYLKVFEIETISDLINIELISNSDLNKDLFCNNLIILGNSPFISNNGFYANEEYIQIGWIYNDCIEDWDSALLNMNNDICNGNGFIETFLKEDSDYKQFMSTCDYDEIMSYWVEDQSV